jgi:hypothetical protein
MGGSTSSNSSKRGRRTGQPTTESLEKLLAESRSFITRLVATIRGLSRDAMAWMVGPDHVLRPRPNPLVLPDGVHYPALARARPASVTLTETYFYERVIARHHPSQIGGPPTGLIQVVVPYDGEQYLSRKAYRDVRQQFGRTAPRDAEALIGHLALLETGRTDLANVLDLSGSFESVPLLLPVTMGDLTYPNGLRADRHACVVEYTYRPDDPELIPVDVDLRISDDEGGAPSGRSTEERVRRLGASGGFHPDLLLHVNVTLLLPNRLERPPKPPRIKRITLDWPTITSLRGLHLIVDGRPHPLSYDPATGSLGWIDVPMQSSKTPHSGYYCYTSRLVQLAIHQPGELYQQDSLGGRVEIEVPGRLLSGLQARLHDATGRRSDRAAPKLSTRLVAEVRLILDEAMTHRHLTPHQLLHFDQVIPDPMRLADIEAALRDCGFRIESTEARPTAGQDNLNHLVVAKHRRGPDNMELLLFVEGRRYPTQRRSRIQGGLTYTSAFESGELHIHAVGILPPDSEVATHEMNEVQAALRDRFERLRARR